MLLLAIIALVFIGIAMLVGKALPRVPTWCLVVIALVLAFAAWYVIGEPHSG